MLRLEGKIAFITGAGSGIGAACARRFAEEGATVVGYDLNQPVSEDWNAALTEQPACRMVLGNILDEAALGKAVTDTHTEFGRIDVLVNSAGTGSGSPVHMMPVEEFDRVLDINLKGTFLACRAVLPTMMQQRAGSIINLASMEGVIGGEITGAYNASKAGVILLGKNMAIDYGRMGIRVNAICPGYIESPMTDMIDSPALRQTLEQGHQLNRMGQPREVANAALFLASDESSFVTGSELMVDGGFTAGTRSGINELWNLGLE